jgi:hypothetical protein
MLITVGDDNVAMNAAWHVETGGWMLKWKATTLKKPVEDMVAEERGMDVLEAAAAECK